MVHKPFISFTGLIQRQKRARYQAQWARVIFHEYSYASSIRCELCKVTFMVHVPEVSWSCSRCKKLHTLQEISTFPSHFLFFLKLNQQLFPLVFDENACKELADFYTSVADEVAKVLIFRCKDDELTGPIIKTNRVKSQPNKEKKKVSREPRKEKPARPHWSEVASSKGFLSPVSMGRTPAEQLQRQAMAPHERFRLQAGRRTTWSRRQSIVFPRWKAKSPGGAAPWCVGHLKIFDRLQRSEKPPSRHSPSRAPPDWPVSLFGPREFKGAAQCAPTPCNEISGCC